MSQSETEEEVDPDLADELDRPAEAVIDGEETISFEDYRDRDCCLSRRLGTVSESTRPPSDDSRN